MNPRGSDFEFLRQFFWPLCHANGLLKVDYVVDRQHDLVEVFSAVRDDFMQISVLLDPVGHGPGDVTESPVALDTTTFTHLILVHHEKVFQLPVAIFNSPSEPIEIYDILSGKTRFICDQNVHFLLVLFPVGAEKNHEFQRDIAVLELSFKEVGLDRLGFSLCRFELRVSPFFGQQNELFKVDLDRGELVERSFAHIYDTGGMRRTHLRGHENILKRLLIHVCGFNLGIVMRKVFGHGTPRGIQGRAAALFESLLGLPRSIVRRIGKFGVIILRMSAFGGYQAVA